LAPAPRRAPTLGQTLQFWWLAHGQVAGLIVAGALGAAFFAVLAALVAPTGPVTQRTGVVTGFRALSSETGTDVYATVDVDGRGTMVLLHISHNCSVGDAIALQKARLSLGEHYAVRGRGCIARAKP